MIQNGWHDCSVSLQCGFILGIKQGIAGHSQSLQLTLASAFHPTTSKQGQWSDKAVHASCQNERESNEHNPWRVLQRKKARKVI